MNYYSHYESKNRFKVKDPRKFKKDFDELVVGEDSYLVAYKEGFEFYGTNIDVGKEENILELLQSHLKEDQKIEVLITGMNSKGYETGSSHILVTDLGISSMHDHEVFKHLKENHYPRRVRCKTATFNNEEKTWLEEGKTYIAVEECRIRNRAYYVIKQENGGPDLTWGKEYFYE